MRVTLDNLRPNMVLATDLKDGTGRLLLPGGAVLTEKHIRYCQMWGIVEVEVVGTDDADEELEPAIDPALVAAAEALVGARFRHTDRDHPAIAPLFRYCVNNQLKKPA